jgi:N-acetylmuramoyl-L-alanine amidase
MRFRTVLPLLAAGVLGAPPAAPATGILAVRHWSAPDHTRIVIDLSEPVGYRHFELADPPRIAVDIPGASFAPAVRTLAIGDGLVKQVRFNVLAQSGVAQVVLDLETTTRYDVFALEKIAEKLDRIVIDVKRPTESIREVPAIREPRTIGPNQFGDFLIMIDPGHGGEDPGRRNPDGVKEKDLALIFSRDLAQAISQYSGYRAELTRTGDYFVSLRRRREIAEQKAAHLFVSVHFNAAPARSARGTEVFFVSMDGADTRATQELVRAENAADLVGGVPPRDHDTSDHLTKMLFDLRQHDSVERSQRLATAITDRVAATRGLPTRNVKQAGFAVLKSLFIPAVLVEVAFLTNPDDVRYVRSSQNRDRYVRALAAGIVDYCEDVEIPRLGWKIHTVDSGETLSKVAALYAMEVSALRGANALRTDELSVGQKLRVRPR